MSSRAFTVWILMMASSVLPEVTEANFADAPPRRLGDAVVHLYDYQIEAMRANARVKVYKWARQLGKDFVASLEACFNALEDHKPWFIVALTERQSLATFDKVKMHLRAFGVVLRDMKFSDDGAGTVEQT